MKSYSESNEQTGIRECRALFLSTASAHSEIRLGATLHKNAAAPLQKLWDDLGLNDTDFGWTEEGQKASRLYENQRERLLREWARFHKLETEWVIDAARDQIGYWVTFPDHENLNAFSYSLPGYYPPEFYIASWFPNEDEKVYRKRVLARFRSDLDKYIAQLRHIRRQLLKDRGSKSAHYRWTVERICLDRSWTRIALENGATVSPQAVQKAVEAIEERIGIPEGKPT